MPMALSTADRSTVDEAEIARFNALAATWWDDSGPMRPLHEIGPARLTFIRDRVLEHFGRDGGPRPFEGLAMLDVGCAAGLVSEPLARLGADVTGIDAAHANIGAAMAHAEQSGLGITYHAMTAEALALEGQTFDVVTALEIVEHVADVPLFMASLSRLVKPGGLLIMSTLNRTAKSFALAVVGAEYVLRWLPRGTHDWRKFITPDELTRHMEEAGFVPGETSGLRLDLLTRRWVLSHDRAVNYLMAAGKP
jgi:2-polyprenyl-6-hydroxyphenyl methylase/3-demethylubiquinone-9 3-methyltransferase